MRVEALGGSVSWAFADIDVPRDGIAAPSGPEPVRAPRNASLEAVRLQRELSAARVAAGEADAAMRQVPIWSPTRRGELKAARDALQRTVVTLEAREAQQARVSLRDVQRARFRVLLERYATLERQIGPQETARLARQTYYGGVAWDGVAASATSRPASRWEIAAAGFPHGAANTWNAAGGFDGDMQTPDGTPVDVGHMLCGVDWQVNQREREGAWSLETVTLGGDLGTAMARAHSVPADEALASEGEADLNGDLDALNVAERIRRNPRASVTSILSAYYAQPDRVAEYASHGVWFVRNADGTPKRTPYGRYELDRNVIERSTSWMARLIRVWNGDTDRVTRERRDAVVTAFETWLTAMDRKRPE